MLHSKKFFLVVKKETEAKKTSCSRCVSFGLQLSFLEQISENLLSYRIHGFVTYRLPCSPLSCHELRTLATNRWAPT